jgi:hypothetical protein
MAGATPRRLAPREPIGIPDPAGAGRTISLPWESAQARIAAAGGDWRLTFAALGLLPECRAWDAPHGWAVPEIGTDADGRPAAVRAALPAPEPEVDSRTPEEILADERAGMRADRLWCRLVLAESGLWEPLAAWAADPARTAAERAYWEDARTWRRADPLVAAAAPVLGLSEAQIDDLFRSAMALQASAGAG